MEGGRALCSHTVSASSNENFFILCAGGASSFFERSFKGMSFMAAHTMNTWLGLRTEGRGQGGEAFGGDGEGVNNSAHLITLGFFSDSNS